MRAVAQRMLLVALGVRAVSVQAIGLARGGDDSLSLLAPEQKDMQCEEGCRFRPFCLPARAPSVKSAQQSRRFALTRRGSPAN